MLKVGLTGGIGCGKSTVCHLFEKLGGAIIDTDELARVAVEPGSSCLNTIAAQFGEGILQADGTLDRRELRDIVFSDREKKEQLEAILHPAIRDLLHQRLQSLDTPYVIVAIPLLLEKGWQQEVDRILVVHCNEQLQISRAMQRDDSSEAQIRAIIGNQVDSVTRLDAADDIIHNDADLDALRLQVEKLHQYYTLLAANR